MVLIYRTWIARRRLEDIDRSVRVRGIKPMLCRANLESIWRLQAGERSAIAITTTVTSRALRQHDHLKSLPLVLG